MAHMPWGCRDGPGVRGQESLKAVSLQVLSSQQCYCQTATRQRRALHHHLALQGSPRLPGDSAQGSQASWVATEGPLEVLM